jgi:transcriptional regulator with XRE-family HTH domain
LPTDNSPENYNASLSRECFFVNFAAANEKFLYITMTDTVSFDVLFCDRLRRLRKRLGMTTMVVAEHTGLDYQQIVRIESEYSFADNRLIKQGTNGSAYVLIRLLNFYRNRVSLDELFNMDIAFHDITIDPVGDYDIQKQKVKQKLKALAEVVGDINQLL